MLIVSCKFSLFVEHAVEYCTTCPWRRCITDEYLNFEALCICTNRNHKKKNVTVNNSSYSLKCTECNKKHHMKLMKSLQFYCSSKSTSRKYNHWNRPSIEFCMNCLIHRPGRNLGYCWFCTECKHHQLNYLSGTRILLYNETNKTKHGGRFSRCENCGRLIIKYDESFSCLCLTD